VSIFCLDFTFAFFYCVVWQARNYVCYERHNTELWIEIVNNTGKNRKMFSLHIQGGREWICAPGNKFSSPPATADRLNFLHDNCLDVQKKNTLPLTKMKHDIGVENLYS